MRIVIGGRSSPRPPARRGTSSRCSSRVSVRRGRGRLLSEPHQDVHDLAAARGTRRARRASCGSARAGAARSRRCWCSGVLADLVAAGLRSSACSASSGPFSSTAGTATTRAITERQRRRTGAAPRSAANSPAHASVPWAKSLRSRTVWLLGCNILPFLRLVFLHHLAADLSARKRASSNWQQSALLAGAPPVLRRPRLCFRGWLADRLARCSATSARARLMGYVGSSAPAAC